MADPVKFNVSAITIFGLTQVASGTPVTQSASDTSGTVSIAGAATTLAGVGTAFLSEVALHSYIYSNTGVLIGQVEAITSDTDITLSAAEAPLTAETFAVGLGPKNALAALNLNYNTELTTESYEYVGDELSRDEEVVITDKFALLDFEIFMPARNAIGGTDPVEAEVPFADWFQSAGMAVILSSDSSGTITYTNSLSTNEYMTIEFRRSSPDIATEKVYELSDCRGTIDLDATVGTRAKLKFNYFGNIDDVVQKTTVVADYQNQKSGSSGSLNSTTVQLSNLEVYDTDAIPIVGSTNFCFDKVIATNMDGFEYDRYQTSCLDGYSKQAIATDVVCTILEDSADAIYNPDDHLEDSHILTVDYGDLDAVTSLPIEGRQIRIQFEKLNLGTITASEMAKYSSQDLNFRNVAFTSIILS